MFRRGEGPLASVLLPTRGRPTLLERAVSSVFDLAHDRSLVELLLRADGDDPETVAYASHLAKLLPVKAIVGPRGLGYRDLHRHVNDLAALARGDWLFLFNDDARIVTDRWDQVLLHHMVDNKCHDVPEVCMLRCRANGVDDHSFVLVRREVYGVLGHLSRNAYVDDYLHSVMAFVHSSFPVGIEIEHMGCDGGGRTKQETMASHGLIRGSRGAMLGLANAKARHRDVGRLLRYIKTRQVGRVK